MLHIDEDKLRLFLADKKEKIERPKYSGIGEIISGISLAITLFLADFSLITFMNPLYFLIIVWLITIIICVYGVISLMKSISNVYTVENLFSEISELDPDMEHPFNIILIKNNRKKGKYLLFKSKRWKCWLFPNYRCMEGVFNQSIEEEYICNCLKRDMNILGDIDIEYLGNEKSYKFSVSDKVKKKYNFHYFMITNMNIQSNKKRAFRFNGKQYSWKTLDQMFANKNIVKKNQDVLDYVRKTCDLS